ncbi:MAG TPA: L-seryl-tRNA(Sec) selenium transferase [Blastocatellia bacterium]|jgi:L-seryl-tRNA(Ser) seleniumtransferase|nr:L-seryl-tRNA(Sec) selenium transferase [Blastocatellia bacterium]
MADSVASKTATLRAIPSVDQLLRTPEAAQLESAVGIQRLTAMAREVIAQLRTQIQSEALNGYTKDALLTESIERLRNVSQREALSSLRRVINATGVILHTNLGRAPLSAAARAAVVEQAAGYCTLEYDPTTGSRGKRGAHAEELLTQLTGAEAALIVNNCASAALLILTVLARDGETIVSRGELVEIGGDFRVPEVMSNSGTRMIEVGSTNRTRLDDYRQAIKSDTRLIMRVHPSNYRIIGFTASPELSQLASLAHESGLPLYEDAGSGVLNDLSLYGLRDEPIVSESIAAGVDLVSFSGDKLLGATQAGLIVGRREIINRLRKHSLYRALRVDKLCLAAIEATLEAHRRGAIEEIPALRMLALPKDVIEERARNFVAQLPGDDSDGLTATIVSGQSAIGGGSGPNTHPETALIALKHGRLSADDVERKLRHFPTPIIARISDDLVLLDLRTVDVQDEADLLNALTSLTT